MISPNTMAPCENTAVIPKGNSRATAELLSNSLGEHSDRDLLIILMGQVLDTKAELRILQATVNTLLIELCHRQPDKLSQTLDRMSGQRYEELITQFRDESDAFGSSQRQRDGSHG
jgi:hypothetical protein